MSVGAVEPPRTTSLSDPQVRYSVPDKPYTVLRRGDLEVVVVDNREANDAVLPGHRAGYHGVGAIRHTRQARNLFVPSYAGLNFEHILDGTAQSRDVLFEPRRVPMQLRVLNEHSAELYQPPTPFWALESCARYEIVDGGVIKLTFECVPRRETWNHGYLHLFWASYIHEPESLDIHFLGRREGQPSGSDWILASTPKHGEQATHRALSDNREFPHVEPYPLELPFGFSKYRYSEPWYFGLCRGMAFAQKFRPEDQVRLTQSPSGGGAGCPAWDFQWLIERPKVNERYQLVMHAIYLPVGGNGVGIVPIREQVQKAVGKIK